MDRKLLNSAGSFRRMSLTFPITALTILIVYGCTNGKTSKEAGTRGQHEPVSVIFETDMGNDIDDALALDMLYKYADKGKIQLLAVNSNKNNDYSVRYIDIMNTWYGYPDIPIGKVVNGADSETGIENYAQKTCQYAVNGKLIFKGSVNDYSAIPDAIQLYRRILSEQPDTSVTIISVGFSSNLAGLLSSPADEYSDLTGKELVKKKVKLLSVMAGSFEGDKIQEYNVVTDIEAAQKVFKEWPGKIVASPFEVGAKVEYPAESIQNDFSWTDHHPVVIAYKNYLAMPYDRPSWDLTSVLYAVEGKQNYFILSSPGTISVDNEGYTNFHERPEGQHRYLKISADQADRLKKRFVNLVSARPEIYSNNDINL